MKSYRLSTSPVRCSHCTLGYPKKSFSSVLFIHRPFFWLFTLSHKKTICRPNPLAHSTWKCHYSNLRIAKPFSSDWKFIAFFQTLDALKRASCGLSTGGSEKNRLWCVATGMSGKQCHSKCSEWPSSALINASPRSFSTLFSHIVHHAVLKFSPCRNKPLPQASTCPYQYTRSSCSVPQTQY